MSVDRAVPEAAEIRQAPRVVATARVPTSLSPASSRGRLGPVLVGQLVTMQLGAIVVVATYPLTDWVFVPAVLLALAACGAAASRRSGRWWYEEAVLRWRLRRRQHRASDSTVTQARPGLALAPSLSVREHVTRGTRLGIGQDGTGWYAVCALTRRGDQSQATLVPVSLDRVVRLLPAAQVPVSALQAVWHVSAEGSGSASVWVALRLAAEDATTASAQRGGGLAGVDRALAAAVGVVGKALQEADLDTQVLSGGELVGALSAVAGGAAAQPAGAGPAAVERWDAWHWGGSAQVCFRVWSASPRSLDQLIAAVGRTSAAAFTASVLVRCESPGRRSTRGLLQVRAEAEQLATTVAEVVAAATDAGFALRRLDGEQAPALYAVAPTGSCETGLSSGSAPLSRTAWRSRHRRR